MMNNPEKVWFEQAIILYIYLSTNHSQLLTSK